jgi:predicted AAA+ superfamily ATPase
LNFLQPEVRQRYERSPQLLGAEVEALAGRTRGRKPLVALDEVQRVPDVVNSLQNLVDRRLARFVLTGSSARKLRRGTGVNLLPGRLVPLRLDPLSLAERAPPTLEQALLYGRPPGIAPELGVAHTTVAGYYEILEDCLIAERIEALSESCTRKKLTKSPRYLFFDLGVRLAAADEGRRLPPACSARCSSSSSDWNCCAPPGRFPPI